MKLLLSLLFAFLIGVYSAEEYASNSDTRVRCSAFAALKIRQYGRGRCKGVAGADCRAVASAQDAFEEAYKTWWAEEGGCEKAKIEEAVQAIADACASVYVRTISKVKCKGKGGFACGYSIADGDAYAEAMARAIAQAAVDASSDVSDAFCVSDVEAIAGTIAEAAASSQSQACIKGEGSQEDFQNAFVESVAQALADAYVKATASTCDAEGATAAQSACYGEAGGDTIGKIKKDATKKAKAEGRERSIELCPPGLAECCKPSFKKVVCNCKLYDCEGRWIKRRDYSERYPRTFHKQGAASVTCMCKAPHTEI